MNNWWGDDPKCPHGSTYRTCQICFHERNKKLAKESGDDKFLGWATHKGDQAEAESGGGGGKKSGGWGCWLMSLHLIGKAYLFISKIKN